MSQAMRHLILATAGHVDHGKSSLVRALTGTDPDRLPEEKMRGMTIDLGFAWMDVEAEGTEARRHEGTKGEEDEAAAPHASAARTAGVPPAPAGGAGGTPAVRQSLHASVPSCLRASRLGIIDVPGHADFVRNMVAGVGSIDLALLVVAADDGWMPQTEEHLQILAYLGVTRGVVALTKIDRIDDAAAAIAAVRGRLRDSPLAEAAIVPTSIVAGEGLAELRAALAHAAAEAPDPADIAKPRLPLDRVFTLPGAGTVVTGTLSGGTLRQGQEIVIHPAGTRSRIRMIQSLGKQVESAPPGARVALNLSGVRPMQAGQSAEGTVARGHVIALAGRATQTLDVLLFRLNAPDAAEPPVVRSGLRIHVHHASASTAARLVLLEAGALAPGEQQIGQLRLEEPLLAFGGDRLVIRDSSGRHTLAGAVVLDPLATRRNWRRPERRRLLEARAASPIDPAAWVASEVYAAGVARQEGLLAQTRFSQVQIEQATAHLAAAGEIVAAHGLLIAAAHWSRLLASAAAAVDAAHRDHPERPGLPVASLRQALPDIAAHMQDSLLPAVVDGLCRDGFVRSGTIIRRSAHRPALPPRLAEAGRRLRAQLEADPLNPPSRKQLAPDATAEQALRFLIINGEAVELSGDCVISAAAWERAVELIRAHIRAHGPATVAELREALGSTRRIMVPLLEKCDQHRLTRRRGDVRELVEA